MDSQTFWRTLQPGELTPTGGAKLRNLLNPANLSRTVEAVRNRYASVWATKSYLDDAFYLTPQASQAHSPARATHSSPSTQSSPCRHAAHSSAVPSSPAYRQTTNNIMTPLRGANPMGRQAQAPPQTPMSSQLESVGWLREAVMHVEADSTALARYFDACERSPKNSIDERVKKLCTQVQTVLSASELATDLSEQLQLGQKLYYKMLLAFLEAEERRLQRTEFSGLLSNAAFHTSLLACCLESVFASYSTSGMAFPAILHHLELQPFDFGKVIESFIKHEPHLPQHLKMHFADIESRIVESLAWQEGSPLHALMSEYDAAIQNGNEAEGSAPQRAKAALEQFVKKCLYLGAKRIQDMCLRLLLPSALVQQVWAVVKLVLDKARNLLVGRHLDQLLMCAVYGVCKVNQRPVTFRHIIEQYRRQQGASPRTFREVKMRNPSDPPADIIQFYNLVFIPAMKDHLLRVCANNGQTGGAAPANNGSAAPAQAAPGPSISSHLSPDLSQARGASSPRHVSAGGGRDVYVSACTPNAHLTPRTRQLYAFSDTPGVTGDNRRLRDINSHVNGQPACNGSQSPLDVLSNAASANGMEPAGSEAGGSDVVESRRAAGGVMASGHKRSRALMGSGSSAGDSESESQSGH